MVLSLLLEMLVQEIVVVLVIKDQLFVTSFVAMALRIDVENAVDITQGR